MRNILKFSLVLAIVIAGAVSLRAQITIENFSSTVKPDGYTEFYGSWSSTGSTDTGSVLPVSGFTQNIGYYTINSSSATNSDSSRILTYFSTPLDLTGLSYVILTAEALVDNAASSLRVFFFDNNFLTASAAFNATSFTTGSFSTAAEVLTPGSGFNAANVMGFYITGNIPNGLARFNYSFDNLAVAASAIPEPSTYAAILGALALGFVAYRRRQRAA